MTKTIMLLITYKCNLHCSYCYEPKTVHRRMSKAMAKRILQSQIGNDEKYDSVEVHFMGGEPLMEYDLIVDLCEWIWNSELSYRNKIIFFAPTNGTLLNDKMKEWFYINRKRFILGLSYDGNIAMQSINRSDSSQSVDLAFFSGTWPEQSVKMTVSPDTVRTLFEGVRYLYSSGFRAVTADLAMGDDVPWTKEHLLIFREELNNFVDYYVEHPEAPRFSMFNLNVTDILKTNSLNPVKTCSCGEDMICFDCDGKEYGCHLFAPISLDYTKARYAREHIDFRNHALFESAECRLCALNTMCSHCYGMNYISTGDVSKSPSFHCSAFKLIFVANCRLQYRLAEIRGREQERELIINVIDNIK